MFYYLCVEFELEGGFNIQSHKLTKTIKTI
jgi:hypothetical protein